jgi:hypothetical protein
MQMKMIVNSRPAFASPDLDGIPSGTVELSVPLIAGVIQIGARGDLEVGRIRVVKTPSAVTVRRVDGSPLQVEIIVDGDQVTRSTVFRQPVEQLRLQRTTDGAGTTAVWYAPGPINVDRTEHLKQFVDIIGRFATAKRRTVRSAA